MDNYGIVSSLIVTHDNRMQELFQQFSRQVYKPNNCACIKLRVIDGKIVQFIQLYNGNMAERRVIYDASKQSNGNDYNQEHVMYDFYIVRHGQGLHNTSNISNKLFSVDPEITQLGIQQAINCGLFLKEYFQQNNVVISYYFVSILNRTHLTMFYILEQILTPEEKAAGVIVHILPNSDEFSKYALPTKLNVSKCISQTGVSDSGECIIKSFMIKDWKYFNKKANYNGMNFIMTAISIINQEQSKQGGKRYKKKSNKTRKVKSKHRKTKHRKTKK
jgi:bisphosphoglycerate-dependent phosphoglycerate mutase